MIRFAVRRPVATVTGFVGLALLGIPSALWMPLELLPDVDFPRLEVSTLWPGASPEQVEALVSSPIEAAAEEVRRVRSVSSSSYAQRSAVTVEFEPGTDMGFAHLDLVERLSALARDLPPGAQRPEVEPWVPVELAAGAQPLLVYTLTGSSVLGALREYALEELAPELAAVPGVGGVEVSGGTGREIRVRLDPDRMAALGIFLEDVREALVSGLNLAHSGGSLWVRGRAITIAVDDRAQGIADLEALVVRPGAAGRPAVRLGELGRVALTYAEPREIYRLDGVPAVALLVHRLAGTNTIAVVDRLRERLARLESGLPPGTRLIEDHDGSAPIREQLAELRGRALLSTACVLLVLFAAFRRWRPVFLVFGTIVVAVLVTLDLMALSGLSLNLFTLAGLAMGIGLIDDNAIVVLESIEARTSGIASGFRWEEEAATRAGARQVVAPIIAASLTNVIVFVPFLYLQGELRAYYMPFAMTVSLALLASLAAAFSLVPALAARVRPGGRQDAAARRSPGFPGALHPRDLYGAVIAWTIHHPRVTVACAFLLLAASGWLFWEKTPRGRTWAGLSDQAYLSVQVTTPPGADLERTDEIVRRIETWLAGIPEVHRYTARVGPGHASILVTFPESLTVTGVPLALKERLIGHSRTFGGAAVRVYGFGPSFQGGGGPPGYGLELRGFDYPELERMADDLAERLARIPRVGDVDPNAAGRWFEREREIELVLGLNRDRLTAYGLTADGLVDGVTAFTHGAVIRETATVAGEKTDLSLQIECADRADTHALLDLVLATDTGAPVRVGEVATLGERKTMGRIVREDQQYRRIVTWEFRGPRKLGDRARDAVAAATVVPVGYELEAERPFWEYEEGEKRELALISALALALVYMVTAAVFESLKAPLVVLAAIPLALIGVFLLYFLSGQTFTREAWIGAVMMGGIVVNNAILAVDRIGGLRRGADGRALPLEEAAMRGSVERVRPILMTTGTTVLGLLPLVLFTEPGTAETWTALALATIGGLVASTLLVLVTIPALYVVVRPAVGDRMGPSMGRGAGL